MNKHAYKLVFNQKRGMLVAVSEVAVNHSKEPNSGQTQGSSGHTSGTAQRIKHGMVMLLMAFQIWQPLLAAPVAITPDNTQAGSKPTVSAANNGVPVVNIIAPNAQGVSINQYIDYNVPTVGLILNNSGGTSLTQLGGYIQGNPMLGNRAASTIVNQVNGPNRSLILGAQEIAGQRANLILANQNGVSINGGSFINTANVTLTTGAPQYNNGALAGYAVKDGLIDVGAGGLDASTTDKLTILTRAAQINGQIWAKQAELITGQNQISFDAQGNPQATASPSSTSTTPSYALDVSAVGGMYAGQMRIIGTEQGLGVNNAGQLVSAGELSLDAQGNLTNSGRMDSGADSHLQVAALDNSGQISAVNNLTLNNQTHLSNSGQLMAGSVQIDTHSLNNTGTLNQTGVQSMDITAQNLNNTGTVGITADTSTPTMDPSTGQAQVSNSSAPQTSTGETANSAGQITTNPAVLNDGYIHVAQDLNNSGQLLTAGALTVHVADTLSNTGAVRTAEVLSVNAQQINNQSAATIASQTSANIHASALNNQGQLQAQTLTATADTLDNRQGSITGEQSLSLNASQTIDNTQGKIESGALTLNATQLNNTSGAIIAQGASNLSAAHINNTQGLVFSTAAQGIQTQQLTNTAGLIQGQALNIQAAQIDNNAAMVNQAAVSGTLIGVDGLSISGNIQLNNNGGMVQSKQLTIDSQTVHNQAGQLTATQNLSLHADSLDNQRGLVYANQTADLTVGTIDNQNTADSPQTGIQAQTVAVQGNTTLNNTSGQIIGDTIQVGTQSLNNSSGFVVGNTVNLNATQLNNQNGTVLADQLNLTSSNYTHQGTISVNDAATLNLTGDFTNQGTLEALGDLSLHTDGNITNATGSTLSADHTLALAGQNITNQSAANIHATHTQLTAQDSIVNDGTIDGGLTELRAGNQIINNSKIYGGDFNGNGGILIGTGNLINNTNAVIASRADMNIGAVNITNDINGLIQTQGDLSIGRTLGSAAEGYAVTGMADRLDNKSARIEVGGNAQWDIANLQNSNMQFAWGTVDGTPIHQVTYKINGIDYDSSQIRLYVNKQFYDASTPQATMGDEEDFQLVMPSATYPFETYGPFTGSNPFPYGKLEVPTSVFVFNRVPKLARAYTPAGESCKTTSNDDGSTTTCSAVPENFAYGPSDAIWTVFGIQAPDSVKPEAPVEPRDPGLFGLSTFSFCTAPSGSWVQKCAAYKTDLENYKLAEAQYQVDDQNWRNRNFNQYLTLNDAIKTFNTDLAARITVHEFDYLEADQVIHTPVVTKSSPAEIIIGQDAQINGHILNDKSQIIVGGTLSGTAQSVENIGADAQKSTTFENVSMIYTHPQDRGGWFSGTGRAYDSIPNPQIAPIIETVHLSVAQVQTNVGSQNIASAAGTRDGSGTATDIAAPAQIQTVPTDNGQEIRTVAFNGILPSNVLFNVANDPNANYIVETDPQYTNKKQFLSSNYLLQQYDPDHIWKRIGDGYYEQKLITDQIITATGKRYVGDYSNNEAQYKALMDNGLAVGKAFSLTVGTALTAEQMSQLTTDIIWMVEETVTLADGSKVKALVPRVYLTSNRLDLKGDGTLIASKNNFLNVTGDVNNNGGTIAAFNAMNLTANTINNTGGTMGGNAGSNIVLRTQGDLNNIGGSLRGGNLALDVGGNLNSITTTYHTQTGDMNLKDRRNYASVRDGIDQVASIQALDGNHSFKDAQGNTYSQTALNIQAQGDINLKASSVSSAGDAYTSAQNINLTTVDTGFAENAVYNWSRKNKHRTERSDTAEVGSILTASGNNILVADRDINAKAAVVNSDTGALIAVAGNDINITNGTATHADSSYTYKKQSGILSSSSTTDSISNHSTTSTGAEFTGAQVILDAGHNATMIGSAVVSDNLTSIHADNDINILNATDTQGGTQFHETKKSGLMGTGGIGFMIGSKQNATDADHTNTFNVASNVGSLNGDVNLSAGNHYQQTGSNVTAGHADATGQFVSAGDVNITAKDVDIVAGQDTYANNTVTKSKQSGLTVAVSVPIVNAVMAVADTAQTVGQSKNDRVNAMALANTAMAGYQAGKALSDLTKSGMDSVKDLNVSVSITVGSSQSKQETHAKGTEAVASNVVGNNVTITATGAGKDSNIHVIGSDIAGTRATTLKADNNVTFESAQSTSEEHSSNSSSGWNAGVAISYGQSGLAFGVTAGANKGKGHGDGTSVTQVNSHVGSSTGTTTIVAGDTTTLAGAQVLGNQVNIDTQNLAIESRQDTAKYDSKQMDMSGQVTVGYGFSASGSYSQNKINADYASVNEQSGVLAGDGGYHINVKDHTDLKGGIITSTQAAEDAGNNYFGTGTITASNIQNHADYDASGFGISGGVELGKAGSGGTDKDTGKSLGVGTDNRSLGVNKSLGYGADDGHNASTTVSGINTANLTITNTAGQAQLMGMNGASVIADSIRNLPDAIDQLKQTIHTTTTTTEVQANSGAIANNFDKDAVQSEIDLQVKVTQQFDITRQQAKAEIGSIEQGYRDKAKEAIERGDFAEAERLDRLADDWQFGGLVLDSVAGALYSPNTNGAFGTVAQVAAPHLVSELGDYFERTGQQGSTGHIVAQGVLGAALAAATGNDALIGGLVSGGSEAFTPILTNWLYGTTNPSELTAEQKSTVSAIVGLGTVGLTASTGAEGRTIANASSTAQNVAENNALKAAVTATKILYKAGKRMVKHGRVKMDDLKQIVKDEGLDILDNVATLADGTLSWDDAKAVIDLVVGTSLNGANKGKALEKINEIVENGKRVKHTPNTGAVSNMADFFKSNDFGKLLGDTANKTNRQYQGQSIFEVNKKNGFMSNGDQFYLDGAHKNHLEVFDRNGNFKFVLNLDGTKNIDKTNSALGRRIPKK